jgi:hypothetical protein
MISLHVREFGPLRPTFTTRQLLVLYGQSYQHTMRLDKRMLAVPETI